MKQLRWLLLCWFALSACESKSTKSRDPVEPSGSQQQKQPAPVAKPVAIAIVFEGWEMWIGNDQLPDLPEEEQYLGALKPFKETLARVGVSGFPAGSQATVVTYGERATVRHPMQSIDKLTGDAFGEQKDYFETVDRNLVGGVTTGLDELAKVKDKDVRRVLLVIGDGNDTNSDTAKAALGELAKRAAAENVEIVSFVYQAALSPPAAHIKALDPSAVSTNSIESLGEQLGWLFVRLKQPPSVVAKGTVPMALVLLVSGSEVWLGNDDFTPANDPSRYEGALKAIKAALEKAPLRGLPKGATAMIATYDVSAKARMPMTPVENVDARALGVQRDYYGRIGFELVGGVTFAFTELLKADAKRRVLVIVGDGADTNNEAAKGQLAEMAKQAKAANIEVYAIVYKGALSAEATVVTALDPYAVTVNSADQITVQLAALFAKLRTK